MNTISTPAKSTSPVAAMAQKSSPQSTASAASVASAEFTLDQILVPIDFSEHSLRAFRKALDLACKFGSELILVHIVEQIIYPGDWMYPPLSMSDFAGEKRQDIAARLYALAQGSGVRTDEVVRLGRAWQEIVEIAKERKADLVVMATHGYTGLRHALLGSVVEKVMRHAPCPVLTVRAEDQEVH